MLKGIDPIVSPDLLFALAKMGHGDVLAIVDSNYPAYAAGVPVVRADGVDSTQMISAVASLISLDRFVEFPLRYMVGKQGEAIREVTSEAMKVVAALDGETPAAPIGREEFYQAATLASVVIVTGETRPYGCFLVTKGVLPVLLPEE